MDRQTVYPGAIPLETDLLNTNKYAMMGLAKLSAAMLGANTYLRGLTCTPSAPPSMTVNIAKGEIYSVQNVDNSAYSSLPADTANTILKQGVVLNSQAFTLSAPMTAGQSINYLIQATYQDIDSGSTVLPYYNAANPSVAYSGPNNSGVAQNTVRSGVCTVSLKPGVAATTGTQITPVADTGYTAAWVITVAQGATSITAANISVAPNAPFIPVSGLVDAIQKCSMSYALDTGSANTYMASYLPNLPTLIDGMRLTFKAKIGNTGPATFAPNGNTAYPLYSHANQALQGGEIIANGLIEVEWNSSLTAWVLCGNSGGALPVALASKSNHAPQLAQTLQVINNLSEIAASGPTSVAAVLANLGLGNDARLSGDLTVAGGLWDTAPSTTPARVWSPNNKPSLSTLGVVDATTSVKGIVELATNAEMASGTSQTLVPPVSAVMSLFSKRTFSTSDYIRIPDVPGGLIVQWVRGTASSTGVLFAQMPTAFPNKLLLAGAFEAGAASWGTDSATTWGVDFANSTTTQVIAYARRLFPTTINAEAATGLVLAIGY